MVADVALYMLVHQPRRLKLPAQPIPRCASVEDITRCLFDERLNERSFRQTARSCYYPAARMILDLVQKQGLRLALGLSLSFVYQAERWEPALIELFRELVAEEGVELVGAEPYHSLHALIHLPDFTMRMRWMVGEMESIFGKRPTLTDATEMSMSTSLYAALDAAGFRGAIINSTPRIMQWRSSNYLYRYYVEQPCAVEIKLPTRARRSSAKHAERDCLGPPYTGETLLENSPYLLARHRELSEEVALRFSRRAQSGYPLYADGYADWIARANGDCILLGWDFETFGERHSQASGIFEFMQALPAQLKQHGIAAHTPGELIDRFATNHAYHLPLPVYPITWAETEPSVAYEGQQEILQCMRDVYNLARLTENPELLDLAIWLAQADNLHHLQWPDVQIPSFPLEWQQLGASGILREEKQVYLNVLGALEPHLPTNILRQAPRKPPAKATRPKSTLEKQNANGMAHAR